MKKVALILMMVAVGVTTEAGHGVSILAVDSSMVYFKVHKRMIGATLEVEDDNGQKLVQETILRKKVIVDFYYSKIGKYKLKIRHGDHEQTLIFQHLDFESKHSDKSIQDHIIVLQ